MVKTNNFNTGNLLRDLHLQCHFHGMEYCDSVCAAFGWTREQYFNVCREGWAFNKNETIVLATEQLRTINTRIQFLNTIMLPGK